MNFDLTKQRTLGLLDTELNQCNKNLQRKAIKIALQTNSVAPEQYSRPGRDCKDHALNRRLTVDARQYERKCFSLAMSDLAGCYDRIVHTAATLALLRLGLKKQAIFAMFDSIQRMTHRVRTGYGDSEATYGGDSFKHWKNAPQGVLQGNAAGPVIWAILSSVIFDILRKKGFCDNFCMCLSRELFELVGFAFVDDADLIQSGQDADEVLQKTQLLLDKWRELMTVTGGAIETKKSYFYIIDYKKQRGRWQAFDPDIGDEELTVLDKDGNRCTLDRLKCSEAAEMLGVWMTMNGDKSKQIEILQEKVQEWTNLVRAGTCTQEVMWYTFQITITKQIEYILLSHTFTEKECTKIFAPAIQLACQRSAIRIFRQTSSEYFGAGAMNIFQQSGVLKISALVMHSWKDSPTNSLLKLNVEQFVLEAGLLGNIWNIPTLTKALIWCSPHSWTYHTATFMVNNNIKVDIKHFELKSKRHGDKAIMNLVCNLPLTQGEMRKINAVRMFYGVVTVSNITSADGRRLDPVFLHRSAFEGTRNNYQWPDKHDITSAEYKSWMTAMHFLFPQGVNTICPLYNWAFESESAWTENWNWFRTNDGTRLIYQEDNSWFSYEQYRQSRSRFSTDYNIIQRPNPRTVERVTVEHDGDFNYVTHSSTTFTVVRNARETMRLGQYTINRPKIPYLFQFVKKTSDNDSAVDCLKLKRYHLKASTTSVDLISSLIELWESVPFQPSPTKVKGHADQLHRPLTFLEHLNCIVDEYAKDIAHHYFTTNAPLDFSREVGISTVQIDTTHVTSNLVSSITSVLDKRTVCNYWSEKIGVATEVLQKQIGWTSIRRARKERSFKQNRFITKFLANDLPHGSNMVEREHAITALCPCCKRSLEDNVHILSCPATATFRDTLLKELDIYIHTEDQLRLFLIAGIKSWMDDPSQGIIPLNLSMEFSPIAEKQNSIGWYSTILGFLHRDIIQFQHSHYLDIKSRRTGTAWAKHVISKLWNIIYQIWEERNRHLHNTSTIDEFKGLEALELSIKVELARGLRTLLRSTYSQHFQLDPDTVQDLSTETKKEWLLLIRSAREALMDAPLDDFTHNNILREWIGLEPTGST